MLRSNHIMEWKKLGCFLVCCAKFRKTTVGCVMSVRMKRLRSYWTDINETWYMSVFRKAVQNIQVWLKYDKNNGHFTRRPCVHVWYVTQFFLEWEVFEIKFVQIVETHILFSITFFPRKYCSLWDNVEKRGTATQTRDDNKPFALYVLDS